VSSPGPARKALVHAVYLVYERRQRLRAAIAIAIAILAVAVDNDGLLGLLQHLSCGGGRRKPA
jgi:hypothetical protein